MALVTRTVSNAGAPLYAPDGSVLANTRITFTIVGATGKPCDVWDATTHERVVGVVEVDTDAAGEFEVALWPNSRGNKATKYLCQVDHPGVREIRATVPAGGTTLSWLEFLLADEVLTPQELSALNTHIADTDAAHAASAISVTPTGGIAATTVQAALAELDSDKQSVSGVAAAVLATVLAGFTVPTAAAIVDSDTVLVAFGKAQAQINAHLGDTANPHEVTAAQVGLGSVDNTSDADKPVSTAQQAALDLKANLDSPTFTGTPLAPTAAAGTNTTQIATTAFVKTAIDNLVDAAPGALDTLNELAAALGDDANFATTVTNALAAKAPLADPTFTGTATIPTLAVTGNATVAGTLGLTGAFTGASYVRALAGQFTGAESATPASGKHVSVQLAANAYGDIYAWDRSAGSAITLVLQRAGGTILVGTVTDSSTGDKVQVAGGIYAAGRVRTAGVSQAGYFDHTSGTHITFLHSGTAAGDVGTGNQLFAGGATTAIGMRSRAGGTVVLGIFETPIVTVSGTGVAVTGTLSASGNITTQGLTLGSSAVGSVYVASNSLILRPGTSGLSITNSGNTASMVVVTDSVVSLGGAVGSESLRVVPVGSAVNHVRIDGSTTGNAPVISTSGSDSNINLQFNAKGTGEFRFFTNNGGTRQFTIANTASAVNYWQFAGSATGNTLVASAQGSDTNITLTYTAKGSGAHTFNNGNGTALTVAAATNTVNYMGITGQPAGSAPYLASSGSDTNVGMSFYTKGTGTFDFHTNASTRQFAIGHVASAVNFLVISGNTTGNMPIISANGTDTNVSISYTAKGAGVHVFRSHGSLFQFVIAGNASAVNYWQFAGSATGNALTVSAQGSDTNIGITAGTKGTGLFTLQVNSANVLVLSTTGATITGAVASSGNFTVGSVGAGGATCSINTTQGAISLRNSGTAAAEVHIRPSTGKSGYITFTEDSVADRWAVGVDNGSSTLNLRPGGIATAAAATLTNAGLLTVTSLRVNVAPTAETPAATHTAVINFNGTNYKVLCLAA